MLRQAIQMAIRLISANLFMLMLAAGLVSLTFLQCALMLAGSVCAVFRTGSNRLRSAGLGRACFLLFMGLVLLPLCGCEQKQEGRMPPGLAKVRYVEVSAEKVTLTRELPGRISAFKVSEVRPQVGGILQARLFEEGTDIEAGQVLYQIDPALYQAA